MRENNLTSRIKELRKNIDEMKTTQYSGSSNTVSYITSNTGTWDFEKTVTALGGGGMAQANVLMVATFNKFTPVSTFEMSITVNGVGLTTSVQNAFAYFALDGEQSSPVAITAARQQVFNLPIMSIAVGTVIKIKVKSVSTSSASLSLTWTTTVGSWS